jgi:hypothetical protein
MQDMIQIFGAEVIVCAWYSMINVREEQKGVIFATDFPLAYCGGELGQMPARNGTFWPRLRLRADGPITDYQTAF